MSGQLYKILKWAKQNGEVKVLDRIRVRTLPITMKENIFFSQITPETNCSSECLEAVREVATFVVGQRCPV